MNHRFEEQRRAAADAFLESLDQIAICLQSNAQEPPEAEPTPVPVPEDVAELDIAALEAAIADIEQFMQQRQS